MYTVIFLKTDVMKTAQNLKRKQFRYRRKLLFLAE
jgi:hypothetical protein